MIKKKIEMWGKETTAGGLSWQRCHPSPETEKRERGSKSCGIFFVNQFNQSLDFVLDMLRVLPGIGYILIKLLHFSDFACVSCLNSSLKSPQCEQLVLGSRTFSLVWVFPPFHPIAGGPWLIPLRRAAALCYVLGQRVTYCWYPRMLSCVFQ